MNCYILAFLICMIVLLIGLLCYCLYSVMRINTEISYSENMGVFSKKDLEFIKKIYTLPTNEYIFDYSYNGVDYFKCVVDSEEYRIIVWPNNEISVHTAKACLHTGHGQEIKSVFAPTLLSKLNAIISNANVENLDESKIPSGIYCYSEDKICPYLTSKCIHTQRGDVTLPHCKYLNLSDSMCSDEDFEKLVELHGSEDAVWSAYPLDLLWDSCKECNVNIDIKEDEII